MELLRSATPPAWLEVALAGFGEVLVDHAHCERKAAASAMSLASGSPEHVELVRRCIGLAQEELRHFRQVFDLCVARGLPVGRDPGDPYVQALLKLMRSSGEERLVDRLLVSALVEARSHERLALLGEALPEPGLRSFYRTLALAEAGHARLFVELAGLYAPPGSVPARLESLSQAEAEVVAALPLVARIH